MEDFKYPNTIYDVPRNLLALLGSWWAEEYAGKDQTLGVVQGKSQIENQSALDMLNMIAAISRFTVPIYHTDNWYPYYVRQSQRNDARTSLLKYDGTTNYDEGNFYDVPSSRPFSAFPKPEDLVTANLIVNRFTDPTLMLNRGVDWTMDDSAIIFNINPFEDARVSKRPVYEDGTIVDYEALLWIFKGDFDFETIYQQFGYVIGMRMQSSKGYRELMNAIWDGMIGGSRRKDILRAFSAMTGVPLVRDEQETVKVITTDNTSRMVITDTNVYKFDLNATPTVEVGDVVYRYQTLTDTLQVSQFNRGQTPSDLQALAIGEGFLSTCFYADLVFENKEVPLTVIEDDPTGFTRVEWPLGGFPLDVQQFFDELHQRGVDEALRPIDDCEDPPKISYPANDCDEVDQFARKATMAHYLDRRAEQIGEPKAAHLPKTINPLQFLVKNILRNNAYLVRVKVSTTGINGVGLYHTRLLQQVVPPHTAMFLLMELTAARDSVTVNLINEQISTYTGMEPLDDVVPENLVRDSRVTVRVVSGTCQ